MIIKSKAPSRIDLAGGTLDIWPIYLLHDNALTVNAAISLYARATIIQRDDQKIIIESKDTGFSCESPSLSSLQSTPPLEFFIRLIKFFNPPSGLHLITDSDVPSGSGLGGSSALGIAVCGALNKLMNSTYSNNEIIDITKDIETQVLKIPSGTQDYYPAVYGGISALWLKVGGIIREPLLLPDTAILQDNLLLCYSGISRFSGTNNWTIMKRLIDGKKETIEHFSNIAAIANDMRKEIIAGRMNGIGKVLYQEWSNRKNLSKGVTNKTIDRLITVGQLHGAISAKICGAGGGGCIVFCVKKGQKEKVARGLTQEGGTILDFTLVDSGLSIETIQGSTI